MNTCTALVKPIWTFTDEGKEIYQGVNSSPGVAVGDTRFSDVDYDGTFFIHKNWDNDWVGVVFSFQVGFIYLCCTEKLFILQDAHKFYLFSSSNNGSMQSTWALKRISSSSGGQNFSSFGSNNPLISDMSILGESEVLWKHPDSTSKTFS